MTYHTKQVRKFDGHIATCEVSFNHRGVSIKRTITQQILANELKAYCASHRRTYAKIQTSKRRGT